MYKLVPIDVYKRLFFFLYDHHINALRLTCKWFNQLVKFIESVGRVYRSSLVEFLREGQPVITQLSLILENKSSIPVDSYERLDLLCAYCNNIDFFAFAICDNYVRLDPYANYLSVNCYYRYDALCISCVRGDSLDFLEYLLDKAAIDNQGRWISCLQKSDLQNCSIEMLQCVATLAHLSDDDDDCKKVYHVLIGLGNMELIDYCIQNDHVLLEFVIICCLDHQHTHLIMQLIRMCQQPFNRQFIFYYAITHNLEGVFYWAIFTGLPYYPKIYADMVTHGRFNMMKTFYSCVGTDRCEMQFDEAYEKAFAHGNLEMLRWLQEKNFNTPPYFTHQFRNLAFHSGSNEMVQWSTKLN